MAVLDPEPYSKITFALGSGTLLTFGGGFGAIRILAEQDQRAKAPANMRGNISTPDSAHRGTSRRIASRRVVYES